MYRCRTENGLGQKTCIYKNKPDGCRDISALVAILVLGCFAECEKIGILRTQEDMHC
ncbi:hypothetical protein SCFA_420029 [anaerobic digester metagenome]|uniref:Uncharacterized protein n=1 Tax=anaerobic digester metagenome TaxID=1263854 RepID=A0A485M0S1_9ZZZZ